MGACVDRQDTDVGDTSVFEPVRITDWQWTREELEFKRHDLTDFCFKVRGYSKLKGTQSISVHEFEEIFDTWQITAPLI